MTLDHEKFRKRLESLGSTKVKLKIALHEWNEEKVRFAQAWLSELEEKSSSETSARTEARGEDILASAKEANSIARDANDIALFAIKETRIDRRIAITAIIIAIITAREDIIWFISWLVKHIIKTP